MQFDHEKLDVYQLEIDFVTWVTPLIEDIRSEHGKLVAEACDHLDRASLSVLREMESASDKHGPSFSTMLAAQRQSARPAWTPLWPNAHVPRVALRKAKNSCFGL